MNIRRVALVLAAAGLLLAASASAALAKEGGIARLDAPIPVDAAPGSTITVGWLAVAMDGADEQPIEGSPVFIRLISPTGAAVEGGAEDPPGSGHYVATLAVPAGGIARVEIGLRGNACQGGECVRSDWLLPVADQLSGRRASVAAAAAPVAAGQPPSGVADQSPASLVADPSPASAGAVAETSGLAAGLALAVAAGVGAVALGLIVRRRRRPVVAHP